MARKPASPILQLIRHTVEDHGVKELPDHELLSRFGGQRDQAAFDGLLRRHGPMVLDVCRNVLGNEADAEDAFQVTFLILAQKAGTIRKKTSVGSWLYAVAYRTALKARAEFATRQKHEAQGPAPSSAAPDDLSWREVQQVLHAELSRFSEHYRAPLVLCYLQGKTQDEAARLLGVSKATLKKHLERGRALLRARLVRRGLGPAAVLAASAWPAATALAGLPPALMSATAKAATGLAAGHAAAGLVSARVAALTERVLKTMMLTRFGVRAALAVALAVVLLLGGLAVRLQPETAQAADTAGPAGKEKDAPKVADPQDQRNSLSGEWAKVETKESGRVRLGFDVGPNRVPGSKTLRIRWKPPAEEGEGKAPFGGGLAGRGGAGAGPIPPPGVGRGVTVGYELKEKEGKKLLVLSLRGQDAFEVPYQHDGDTLTLDGGVFQVGRGAFLKVEMKGQWRRVNVALEEKLRKAVPGLDVEGFSLQLEGRGQRLLVAANKASVQPDGRIRFEDCVVVRLPSAKDGARPAGATAIRSAHAVFQLDAPARTVADLGSRTIIAVECADGVRMTLKEQ